MIERKTKREIRVASTTKKTKCLTCDGQVISKEWHFQSWPSHVIQEEVVTIYTTKEL